jgi:hypothetical protein
MSSSQEETFQTIMNYFAERRYKIVVSNSPSLVKAEFGSYLAMSFSAVTAKGEMEVSIVKRNGGSCVNLNFDFTKGYLAGFISAVFGALLCFVVAYLLVSFSLSGFPSWAIENAWSMFNTIMISAIVAVFIGTMSLEAYYVSRTRKRIIEEFNKLSQSLSARK